MFAVKEDINDITNIVTFVKSRGAFIEYLKIDHPLIIIIDNSTKDKTNADIIRGRQEKLNVDAEYIIQTGNKFWLYKVMQAQHDFTMTKICSYELVALLSDALQSLSLYSTTPTFNFTYNGNQCSVNKFSFSNMVTNPHILIVGHGCDVVRVAEIIIETLNDEAIIISSSSVNANGTIFAESFPNNIIFETIEDADIPNILQGQSDTVALREYVKKTICLDISDIDSGTLVQDHNMQELLRNGRHYYLACAIVSSLPTKLPPDLRLNLDYVILLAEKNMTETNKRHLYDRYATGFRSFEDFETIFDLFTQDNGVMIIDNRTPANDYLTKIYYYNLNRVLIKNARQS